MFNTLLVFLGCGLGGVCRYGVATFASTVLSRSFPHGTFIVNISGSFLIGLLTVLIHEKLVTLGIETRAFLVVGFLGGYTTFSSFSMDTLNLVEAGHHLTAIFYILGSVLLCLVSVWAGALLARQL